MINILREEVKKENEMKEDLNLIRESCNGEDFCERLIEIDDASIEAKKIAKVENTLFI